MTLRQELEALEAVLAAGRHKGEWSTDAALALCRRAVEDADENRARANRWAAMGEVDAAEIARLRAQIDDLAEVLLDEFGGPTQDESACEMAVRVLRSLREEVEDFKRQAADNATFAGQEASRADHAEIERDAIRASEQRERELLEEAMPGTAILCESKEWERDLSEFTGIGEPVPPCGECWTCRARAYLDGPGLPGTKGE